MIIKYIFFLVTLVVTFATSAQANPVPWSCSAAIVVTTTPTDGEYKIENILLSKEGSDYSIYSTQNAIVGAFNQIELGSHVSYCNVAAFASNSPMEYTWEVTTHVGRNFCTYSCRDENYGIEYLKEFIQEYAERRLDELIRNVVRPQLGTN